jgi:hypothetical protein
VGIEELPPPLPPPPARSLIADRDALVPREPPDLALRGMRPEALVRDLDMAVVGDGMGMVAPPRPGAEGCCAAARELEVWRRGTMVIVERKSSVVVVVTADLEERGWCWKSLAPSWGEMGVAEL